jgi:hypothetical protein
LTKLKTKWRWLAYNLQPLIAFGVIGAGVYSAANPWVKSGVVFIVLYVLLRKGTHTERGERGQQVASAIGSLLIIETGIVMAFLPLSQLGISAFLTLLFIIIQQLQKAHFVGKLRIQAVLGHATIVAIVTLILLITAKWGV